MSGSQEHNIGFDTISQDQDPLPLSATSTTVESTQSPSQPHEVVITIEELQQLLVNNPDILRQLTGRSSQFQDFSGKEGVVLVGDDFAIKVFALNKHGNVGAAFLQEVLVRTQVRHTLIVPLGDICEKKTVQVNGESMSFSYIVMDKCNMTLKRWLKRNKLDYVTCIGLISDLLLIAHTLTQHGLAHGDMHFSNLVVSKDSADVLRLKLLDFGRAVSQKYVGQDSRGNYHKTQDADRTSVVTTITHLVHCCADMDHAHKQQFLDLVNTLNLANYSRAHGHLMKHVAFNRRYPFIAAHPYLNLDNIESVRPESFDAQSIEATVALPTDPGVWASFLRDPNKNALLPAQWLSLAHPSVPDSVYDEITAGIETKRQNQVGALWNGTILAIKRINVTTTTARLHFELTSYFHHSAMTMAWMRLLKDAQRAEHIARHDNEFWTSFGVHLGIKTADGYLTFVRRSRQQNKEVDQISCGFSETVSVKDIETGSNRVNLFDTARRGLAEELNVVLGPHNDGPIKFIGLGCEYRYMLHGFVGVVDLAGTEYTKHKLAALLNDPVTPPIDKFEIKELVFVPLQLTDVFDFLVLHGAALAPGCFACTLCCLYHSFNEIETDSALINYLRVLMARAQKQ